MRRNHGFTMIEVLIAMIILGISMLGMHAVMADRVLARSGVEERRSVADQLVNDRIDALRAQAVHRFATIAPELEYPVQGHPNWVRQTLVQDGMPGAPGALNVTVRVWWREAAGDTASRTMILAP